MKLDIATVEDALAVDEAGVEGIRPGCAKQIVWAGDAGVQTPICLLYIHGFSATAQETRPVPDLAAEALGANLYFTRLTGHGQSGAALAEATLDEWLADMAEALAVARCLGQRVILMGCSTGCSLATIVLGAGEEVLGCVFVSPNYGMSGLVPRMLFKMPGIRSWGHLVAGREQNFAARSEAHAVGWTLRYPTKAVFAMDASVRSAWQVDMGAIKTPTLFAFAEGDKVVSPKLSHKVMGMWGGKVDHFELNPGDGDDADKHVSAGDILSPSQTKPLAEAIIAWAQKLG